MSNPEYLYYAALWFVAFPTAAFSRVAGVVVLAWLVAHIAVLCGLDDKAANLAQHTIGLAVASLIARSRWGKLATAIYLPMVLVDGMVLTGKLAATDAWDAILALATIQCVILPFAIRRGHAVEFARRLIGRGGGGIDLMISAIRNARRI